MVMAFVMVMRLMDVLILKLATSMKRQLMMTDLVTAWILIITTVTAAVSLIQMATEFVTV